MAYEDETFEQTCDRIISKLRQECQQREEEGDCLKRKLDFEERCTQCQAAGLIFFSRGEIPSLTRKASQADHLGQFQRNVLGGWG